MKKNETIFAKNFARNCEKKTWNIRRLVDDSFIPANQKTSVLYRRLSDIKAQLQITLKPTPLSSTLPNKKAVSKAAAKAGKNFQDEDENA